MELSPKISHATKCWQASHATFFSQNAMQQKCCLLKSLMQSAMQTCAGKPPVDSAKHSAPTWMMLQLMLQLNSATGWCQALCSNMDAAIEHARDHSSFLPEICHEELS